MTAGAVEREASVDTPTVTPIGVAKVVVGLVVVVGWLAFWGNVVRLHVANEHLIDAGFTVFVTVVPAVPAAVWSGLSWRDGASDVGAASPGPASSE